MTALTLELAYRLFIESPDEQAIRLFTVPI